jgi:hypothetical protein
MKLPSATLRAVEALDARPDFTRVSETPPKAEELHLTPEQAQALRVAHGLVDLGVPVGVARPAMRDGKWDPFGGTGAKGKRPGLGYWMREGWEKTRPDHDIVDGWRPGDALFALMNGPLNVLDQDPRNGGDKTAELWKAEGIWPEVYGQQDTPSVGHHDLVASLGIGAKHPDGGIDLIGSQPDATRPALVFLAPTVKASKDGEISRYRWVIEPDFGRIRAALGTDHSGDALARRLTGRKRETSPGTAAPASNWDGTIYWEGSSDYETNAVSSEAARLVRLGTGGLNWDITTFEVACNLIEIANSGWSTLTVAEAKALVHEHTPTDEGWDPQAISAKIESAHKKTGGKTRPMPLELRGKKLLKGRNEDNEQPARTLNLINLADVEFEVTEWAWDGVIPLGILTGVAGWAGIGKSTLLSLVAANLTRGRFEGDLHGQPAPVLIVAGEDDVSRQLAPRLKVADADLDLVSVIQPTTLMADGQSVDTVMQLTDDIAGIRRILIETGAKMLILDPILSFVDGNPNAQGDVRRALDPLAALARELNIAVVVVMHFKKGHGLAGEKVSGSHVWRDALRSLLVMAVDEESGYRVVSIDKSNYSDSKGRSMLFEVIGAEVQGRDTKGNRRVQHVSRAKYIGDSPKSVDDILEAESVKRDGRRVVDDTTSEVIEWICAQPEPVPWAAICRRFDVDPNGKDPDSMKAKNNLTRKLSRAVDRGDIEKADKGLYRKPTGLRPLNGLEDF